MEIKKREHRGSGNRSGAARGRRWGKQTGGRGGGKRSLGQPSSVQRRYLGTGGGKGWGVGGNQRKTSLRTPLNSLLAWGILRDRKMREEEGVQCERKASKN